MSIINDVLSEPSLCFGFESLTISHVGVSQFGTAGKLLVSSLY